MVMFLFFVYFVIISWSLDGCVAFSYSKTSSVLGKMNFLKQMKNAEFNKKSYRISLSSSSSDDSWVIDSDTSEIECESSAGLQRKKEEAEKLRIAAELAAKEAEKLRIAKELAAKEAEERRAKEQEQLEEEAKKKNVIVSTEVVTTTSSPTANKVVVDKQPIEKKTAFDIGLILVFPLLMGTLFLFLFFPIIGQQLAASSSPPPV